MPRSTPPPGDTEEIRHREKDHPVRQHLDQHDVHGRPGRLQRVRQDDARGVEDLRRAAIWRIGRAIAVTSSFVVIRMITVSGKRMNTAPRTIVKYVASRAASSPYRFARVVIPVPQALPDQRLGPDPEPETGEERHEQRRDHHLARRLLRRADHPRDGDKDQETRAESGYSGTRPACEILTICADHRPGDPQALIVPVSSSVSGRKVTPRKKSAPMTLLIADDAPAPVSPMRGNPKAPKIRR